MTIITTSDGYIIVYNKDTGLRYSLPPASDLTYESQEVKNIASTLWTTEIIENYYRYINSFELS